MFLRKKAASWSAILLRDEILHAGIRHSRKRLEAGCRTDRVAESTPAEAAAAPAGVLDRQAEQARPIGW